MWFARRKVSNLMGKGDMLMTFLLRGNMCKTTTSTPALDQRWRAREYLSPDWIKSWEYMEDIALLVHLYSWYRESSLCKGKYPCIADFLFNLFGFCCFAYVELTDVLVFVKSIPVKQEVSQKGILPFTKWAFSACSDQLVLLRIHARSLSLSLFLTGSS